MYITKYLEILFTSENSVTSILPPRFDFRNDFTSPRHMYGNTISSVALH